MFTPYAFQAYCKTLQALYYLHFKEDFTGSEADVNKLEERITVPEFFAVSYDVAFGDLAHDRYRLGYGYLPSSVEEWETKFRVDRESVVQARFKHFCDSLPHHGNYLDSNDSVVDSLRDTLGFSRPNLLESTSSEFLAGLNGACITGRNEACLTAASEELCQGLSSRKTKKKRVRGKRSGRHVRERLARLSGSDPVTLELANTLEDSCVIHTDNTENSTGNRESEFSIWMIDYVQHFTKLKMVTGRKDPSIPFIEDIAHWTFVPHVAYTKDVDIFCRWANYRKALL